MAAPSNPFPLQLDTIKYGQEEIYRWLDDLVSEGVVTSGDGEVTQYSAGEMRVNVAAGEAYASFDSPYGGKRKLRWTATQSGLPGAANTADNWLSTFTAAHGTLPRIDRVVTTVQDASLDATGQRRQVFQVLAGTATSGADLTNLTGAVAVPVNSILLANVLVRAATTQILTADIASTVGVVRPKSNIGGRLETGGIAPLSDQTLTAAAATVDFQNISAGYKHLKIVAHLRGAAAANATTVAVRFNNDSAANYDYLSFVFTSTGSPTQAETFAGTSGLVGDVPAASARVARFGSLDILIPDYANTTREKSYQSETGFAWAVAQSINGNGRGAWRSAAAINRVTLTSSGGNFDTGSRATLYGIA